MAEFTFSIGLADVRRWTEASRTGAEPLWTPTRSSACMALLLQMPAPTRRVEEGLGSVPLVIGAASAAQPSAPAARFQSRAPIKAALREYTYTHIVEARMSHIPTKLPFPTPAIVRRLRENDQQPPNRALQERRLELDTDLTLLSREIQDSDRAAKRRERRERRLSRMWSFLVTHSERTQLIVDHRIGRLRNNIEVFFRSDLPGDYLASCGDSTHWEVAALALAQNAQSQRLVHRLVRRPAEEVDREVFMATEASLSEIDRAFREYQNRFEAISALADKVLEWRDALEYYVDLFSAPDLHSFRLPRHISVSSLDSGFIAELAAGLREVTVDLRRKLAGEYPGGLSEIQWMPRDDPHVASLIQLELEAAQEG